MPNVTNVSAAAVRELVRSAASVTVSTRRRELRNYETIPGKTEKFGKYGNNLFVSTSSIAFAGVSNYFSRELVLYRQVYSERALLLPALRESQFHLENSTYVARKRSTRILSDVASARWS